MIDFYSPYYLLLLLLVPFLIWYEEKRKIKVVPRLNVPSLKLFIGVKYTFRTFYNRFRYVLNVAVYILLVIALARPRSGTVHQKIETEGIDIMLVMDISTSMKAIDFKPANRLEAAKKIAVEFIGDRHGDRIGLVAFGGESFTQCPLTVDYDMLVKQIEALKFAPKEWDGTAIGNAIGTAVDRLKDVKSKSKIIILLTDGRNNAGEIDPLLAADLASTFNIKIYTIGAGAKGEALYPVESMFGPKYTKIKVDIDEDLLRKMAEKTGGKYFRATNTDALRNIYLQISKMEKTKIEINEFVKYRELYFKFAAAALMLLALMFMADNFWLKKIPSEF